jgi:acyl-CoA thioester hydrolase
MEAMSALSELRLQPRYSETDAMGIVYYANYLIYFEVARTTALADLGHPYWEMEKKGWLIPVLRAHCEYQRPARYGDSLVLRTRRMRLGKARIRFEYELRREGEDALLVTGYTEHAFMSPEGKPLRPPAPLMELFP